MTDWQTPTQFPELAQGDVHVWRKRLDLSEATIAAGRDLLSSDEVARADRFAFDRPRNIFVACRGALRTLLAQYVDVAPAKLSFCYGQHGKPDLALDGRAMPRFNLSHTDGWALIGVTVGHRIGVDIEERRPIKDLNELARICFSTSELAAYQRVQESRRVEAFYNGWTRKEAFIKATGKGLAFGLSNFDVTLAPGESISLLRVEGDSTKPEEWTLAGFDAGEQCAGAVAIDAPEMNLCYLSMA